MVIIKTSISEATLGLAAASEQETNVVARGCRRGARDYSRAVVALVAAEPLSVVSIVGPALPRMSAATFLFGPSTSQ